MLDFTLENLTVQVGDTITWENEDAAPHTSTSGVSPDNVGILEQPSHEHGRRPSVSLLMSLESSRIGAQYIHS
jgi:plastocyanin